MTPSSSVTSLPPQIKDLVAAVGQQTSEDYYGQSEKDRADVSAWIDKAGAGHIAQVDVLPGLDTEFTPLTYVVSNRLTAADVALYAALHPTISQLSPDQYYALPALTRWFDHIQSLPVVCSSPSAAAFATVNFDLENAPKPERKADPPKEKKKQQTTADAERDAKDTAVVAQAVEAAKGVLADATKKVAEMVEAATGSTGSAPSQKEGKQKAPKEKGGAAEASKKGKGGKPAPAAAPAEDAGEPVPSMIDLRVGHILDIHKHPDADGLYVEQIDFGEESGPRTVVSGLVHYIPIENMRDKYLVGVCNLKPANMRGVKSFAMVLCATSKDGKEGGIELVQPPANSKPGDRVYFEGAEYQDATPLSQLNPKKKIFETIQPGFTTLETREAAWVDPGSKSIHRIRTKDGVCLAPTLVGASLS